MYIRFTAARRQSGAALIVLLALLLLVSAAILLDRLNGEANASATIRKSNANSLAEAKTALIAWSATRPATANRQAGPGSLPFPDRNNDGNYDGWADCEVLGVNDAVLVGRLPRSGEDAASCGAIMPLNVDLQDGAGEPLWYAVSRNLISRSRTATGGDAVTLDDASADFVAAGIQAGETVVNTTDGSQATVINVTSATRLGLSGLSGGRTNQFAVGDNYVLGPAGPVNPDMGGTGRMTYPWIQLRDAQGNVINDPNTGGALAVAAVIFAPGPVVGNQDRSGVAAAANYLDSITIVATTYDNADADGCPDNTTAPCGGAGEEFVVYPNPQSGEAFNDDLVYITVDELMRAVEKRVLGEAAQALRTYRLGAWNTNGVFPWLAEFRSPRAVSSGTATGGSAAHVDVATADFLAEGVQAGDTMVNISDGSRGPVTAVTTTRIDFEALMGGTENDVDVGENFIIEPSFKGDVTSGDADATSSATHLDDAAGNFIAEGVKPGNFIVNTDDGSSGLITSVPTATRINFAGGLVGGLENDFDAGEHFMVLSRAGQLPVHGRNEIFATSFIAEWHLHTVDEIPSGSPSALIPDDSEIQGKDYPPSPPPAIADRQYRISVTRENGRCLWTEAARVDCVGIQVIPAFWRTDLVPPRNVIRTMQVSISFTGTNVTITPPTANDVRRRSVSIGNLITHNTLLPDPAIQPPPMLPQNAWYVIVTDQDGGNSATMRLDLNGSNGWIVVNGIRYDLSVVYDDIDDTKDELPEWFVENNWHHFIFAALSSDVAPGGDNDCTNPAPDTCLTLNVDGFPAPIDIRALLISAGAQRTKQDRAIGECDGVVGLDPNNDSFFCAYFDSVDTAPYNVSTEVLHHGSNAASINTDLYARDVFSANFNDQVRIIEPLPP